MGEIWMMSNRQPWVEALLRGWITSKTRSPFVHLPPVGATVYLHASKTPWGYWKELAWVRRAEIDVRQLPRGGVAGCARVIAIGPTSTTMPENDREYFRVGDDWGSWSCADYMTIVFEDIVRLPFLPCRGALVPTRKLPPELTRLVEQEAEHGEG